MIKLGKEVNQQNIWNSSLKCDFVRSENVERMETTKRKKMEKTSGSNTSNSFLSIY